jgi:hypothetical protein
MRLRLFVPMLLIGASLLSGQQREAAIIPVKTLSGDSFNRLVKLLGVFNVRLTSDDKLRTIVVYAPKETIAEVKRVIEQLDQPGSEAAVGRNMEMTLSFLRASTGTQSEMPPLPADLEAVAKQLRAATQYKSFQLWDIIPVHIQEGKTTDQSFRLPVTNPDLPHVAGTGQIRMKPEAVTRKDTGRYVRFDVVNIGFRIPVVAGRIQPANDTEGSKGVVSPQYHFVDVGLTTAGDFKEGQKTVLGKVSGIDDKTAIFVVVSLKILD